MAEINVERKKSATPWIIGLIVLALIIWGLFALFNNNEADVNDEAYAASPVATTPVVTNPVEPEPMESTTMAEPMPMPPPPTDADNTPIPVAIIVMGPADFLGQPVVGTAKVVGVPTDRGFWIEQDGQRIYAVIAKSANMEEAVNVNPGQQVRLAGIVYDTELATRIDGGLDAETQQVIADQPAFLLVNARNVMVVES